MKQKDIIFYRNFLLRTFLVGLGIAVVLVFFTICFWKCWSGMLQGWIEINPETLGRLFVNSVLNIRTLLFFVILAPAIALHWIARRGKNRS